jgi:hypothetical protein
MLLDEGNFYDEGWINPERRAKKITFASKTCDPLDKNNDFTPGVESQPFSLRGNGRFSQNSPLPATDF